MMCDGGQNKWCQSVIFGTGSCVSHRSNGRKASLHGDIKEGDESGRTGIQERLRTRLTAYRTRGPVCSAKPPWVHTTKEARPRKA